MHGYPWAAWDLLREQAPVFWYERDDVEPFWAVTRYADVMTVSNLREGLVISGPWLRLTLRGKPEPVRAGMVGAMLRATASGTRLNPPTLRFVGSNTIQPAPGT